MDEKIVAGGQRAVSQVMELNDSNLVFTGYNNNTAHANAAEYDIFAQVTDSLGNLAGCSFDSTDVLITAPSYTYKPDFFEMLLAT